MDSDSSDGTVQSDVYAFGMTALEVRIFYRNIRQF